MLKLRNARSVPLSRVFGLLAAVVIARAWIALPSTFAQDIGDVKPAVCFAPDADPKIVEVVTREGFGNAPPGSVAYNFSDGNRWPGGQGNPRNLTWSLIPDGVFINVNLGGGCGVNGPSSLFARLDSQFNSQGGRAVWINRIQQVFDRWSKLTGTSYTRLATGGADWDDGASFGSGGNGTTRGDIRIGMVTVDGAGCGSILAFNFFPGGGIGGDMVLNRSINWATTANNNLFLRNVVAHEHGHGIGLSHVCPSIGTKLMEPFVNTAFDGPQHDDIRAGQRGYGDPFEPNDTVGESTDLGILSNGMTLNVGSGAIGEGPVPFPVPRVPFGSIASLDADGEQDFYRFTLANTETVSIKVTPIGLTYDSSFQQFSGSCSSGSFVDSLRIADLNVQLIDTDGVTVLATAAVQPIGNEKVIPPRQLAAGAYFVRVFEGNTPTQSQLYNLSFSTELNCTRADPLIQASTAVAKNRYLEFRGNNPGRTTAVRLTLLDAPPPLNVHNGTAFWVAAPTEISEDAGKTDPADAPGTPTFLASSLQCDPFYADWSAFGTIHVFGKIIIPGSRYTLQEVDLSCDPTQETAFSAPLIVATSLWGDIISDCSSLPCGPPDGSVNVTTDVTATLDKFKNLPGAPTKARADLEPNLPDLVINISDVTKTLDAFSGSPYPFDPGPSPCAN